MASIRKAGSGDGIARRLANHDGVRDHVRVERWQPKDSENLLDFALRWFLH